MSELVHSAAWQTLAQRYRMTADVTLTELFAADPERAQRLASTVAGVTVNMARTHLTPAALDGLLALAGQQGVLEWRDRMFAGERLNHTEQRPALHAALRTPELATLELDGVRIDREIDRVHRRMAALVDGVTDGRLRNAEGGPITDIVHVGIGGSDLGPRLVCQALGGTMPAAPRVHFVSNLDPFDRERALADVDLTRALVIVASKTFSTVETLSNARALFDALAQRVGATAAREQFIAITGRPDRAREWGLAEESILPLWDWVGGRFSLWSAIGLPVAFALGMDGYRALLAGAAAVDRHFRDASGQENVPLLLALLDVWYFNFAGFNHHVVVPYSERLALLPSYLQQLEMESNGKSVDRDGEPVDYATAPAVWGQVGTTGQHALFQWLHQGTGGALCDFIVVDDTDSAGRAGLAANALAQGAALMTGRSTDELRREGIDAKLRCHRAMGGNRPSVTLVLDGLTPQTLGALLALYEHRVFCQAMIWRINPFDQWGVELGKKLAGELTPALLGEELAAGWDAATQALVGRCRSKD